MPVRLSEKTFSDLSLEHFINFNFMYKTKSINTTRCFPLVVVLLSVQTMRHFIRSLCLETVIGLALTTHPGSRIADLTEDIKLY